MSIIARLFARMNQLPNISADQDHGAEAESARLPSANVSPIFRGA